VCDTAVCVPDFDTARSPLPVDTAGDDRGAPAAEASSGGEPAAAAATGERYDVLVARLQKALEAERKRTKTLRCVTRQSLPLSV
jgi:hypothetical protein